MPNCENCGSHVSHRFVRVFGSNGTVEACTTCGPNEGHSRRLRRVDEHGA